jgi:hypothetical protein
MKNSEIAKHCDEAKQFYLYTLGILNDKPHLNKKSMMAIAKMRMYAVATHLPKRHISPGAVWLRMKLKQLRTEYKSN